MRLRSLFRSEPKPSKAPAVSLSEPASSSGPALAVASTPEEPCAPPPSGWLPRLLEDLEVETREGLEERIARLTRSSRSNPRIYLAVADPDTDIDEVVQLVSTDPDLAARILRVVNSPSFGLVAKVKELPRAIALLGYAEIRTLVLKTGVDHVLRSPESAAINDKLWLHSYTCSVAAMSMAQACQAVPPSVASTVGLLHDLGRIALGIIDLDLSRELESADLPEDGEERGRREEEALGAGHAALGALIARQWGLPDELVQGINLHTLSGFVPPEQIPQPYRALASVLCCADSLSHWIESQTPDGALFTRAGSEWQPPAPHLRALGSSLTPRDLADPDTVKRVLRARQIAMSV